MKQVLYGKEARDKLRAGINKTANAVKVTMGARGRVVGLSHGPSTKDGVSVARDIDLEDPFENKGAQLLKVASIKTNDVVGDGTTATAVLAQALVNGGFDLIEKGKDAQQLRRELEEIRPKVLKEIEKQSFTVESVIDVASISANDQKIGALVAQAVDKVGADGLVVVENSYTVEDEVEVVSGMQLDKGIKYPVFFTDPSRRRAEYEKPIIVVYEGDIHDTQGFFTFLTPALSEGKAIVIISNSIDSQVLHNLFVFRLQKGIKVIPITSPHVYREESLEDIAIFTGARVLKESDSLSELSLYDVCGVAQSVVSTPDRTVIRSTGEFEDAVAKRIAYIEEHANSYKESERREIMKRVARLKGQIAIIRTHSTTDEEAKEKRDRFDDAIFASQASIQNGVVEGAGMAYLLAGDALKSKTDGAKLVREALEAPMRQIAINAGRNAGEVVEKAREGLGYNAKTDEFCELQMEGIIDPTKALTTAFENALSVALIAITTEALVATIEKPKE